jgi:Rho termination factor-like protein
MNVTELKALAKSLGVTGFSKLRKAELILAIGDALYDEATAEYDHRNEYDFLVAQEPQGESDLEVAFWEIANAGHGTECAESVSKPAKPHTMGTPKRLAAYYRQNGSESVWRLTRRQVRRINKKIRKEFANA